MEKKFKKMSKNRGVTIPRDMAELADMKAGTALDLTVADGKIIISKHIDTCRFCGSAENVKRFHDVCCCPMCAAELYKEVAE